MRLLVDHCHLGVGKLCLSFAKTSSDSLDDGRCSRDRPRERQERLDWGWKQGSWQLGSVGPTTERGGAWTGTASGNRWWPLQERLDELS